MTAFQTNPAIAWVVLGALGPLVSAGIIDRLPLRAAADIAWRNERGRHPEDDERTLVSDARYQASHRILLALYEDTRVREVTEYHRLRGEARHLIDAGRLHFDDVEREIRLFAIQWRWDMPHQLAQAFSARSTWPTDEDPGRETAKLVDAALLFGFARPVSVACRAAAEAADRARSATLPLIEPALDAEG